MRGFTISELLVVIAIAIVLFSIVVSSLSNFRNNSDLVTIAEEGISALLEARTRTLSAYNGAVHGVHFESGKFVLFQGAVYNPVDPLNKETLLPSTVTISTTTLAGGGQDVVFKRLTGDTDQYGTVRWELVSNSSIFRIIEISQTGLSSLQ